MDTKYRKDIFNPKNICLIKNICVSVWCRGLRVTRAAARLRAAAGRWCSSSSSWSSSAACSSTCRSCSSGRPRDRSGDEQMIMVLIYTPLCCAAERELGEEESGAPEPHGGEEAARPRPRAGGEPGAAPGAEAAPGGGAPGGRILDIYYLPSIYCLLSSGRRSGASSRRLSRRRRRPSGRR